MIKSGVRILEIPSEIKHERARYQRERVIPFIPFWTRRREIRRLLEDVFYSWRRKDGTVVGCLIRKGFEWDGASIPAAFWRLVGGPWNKHWLKAALLHDALYCSRKEARAIADDLFHIIMLLEGSGAVRAEVMERAVEDFGKDAWRERTDDDMRNAMFVECTPLAA